MINDLRPGNEFISFFVLRKKEIKTRHDSDEIYLALEFGDASGRITGTLWENVQEHFDAVERGDVVKVKGKVINFKERRHLTVRNMRRAEDKDAVDFKQLIPSVEKDRGHLFAHLDEFIASVSNPYLNKLLNMIFSDEQLRQSFGDAPAGKLWHHNYLGGLLEHSLAVTEICDKVGQMYPAVHRDLLVAGGLLHDIGKINSYSFKTFIDFTDAGRLVGHIVIGTQLVADKIKSIKDFPPKLEMQLMHLILSHQGKLEQASPVVPMTLEGLILYYADELDSKANAFLRIMKMEKKAGATWSSYVQLLNQYFYLGDREEEPGAAKPQNTKTREE